MALGLARNERRIEVVTAHPHYPEWRIREGYGEWSRREHLDGVIVTRLRHYVPAKPSGVRRLVSEISFGLRLVAARWRRPAAIVLVSPALFSSALAAVRARIFHRRTPVVVWVQDLYTLGLSETGQGSGLTGRVIRVVEGWVLRHADRVVVIHERFARRVSEDFSIPRERIEVVRNWTHLPPMPPVDRESARRALGWGDEIVVLHAGNMGVKQGLENVLAAARLADRSGASIRFVLMGNGGEKARLTKEGAGIGALQFLPPLPDDEFAQALVAADVLLVNEKPGVAEMAVPSKLTSYFSTGRPVLAATDETGITAEEVTTAKAGVVVPAGDPAKLLEAALSLGNDSARSTALGANGLNYRNTVLDETFAIDRFATLLSLLIDGDGSRTSNLHKRPSKTSI
jgi:glycosyltransferase involved in cell wall biosynthesis